ncbi:cytoplasmic polyadenylation element-binding protein 1-B-like, partial [Nilaparvata lugens]
MAAANEQALFEEAARYHRSASIRQIDCPCYDGDFPIREYNNPTYSVKVFLGGVPWDITEENLIEDLSPFGRVSVQWPSSQTGRGASLQDQSQALSLVADRKDGHKKGYVYVIFEADAQ